MFNCNNNFWNLEYENSENILLNVIESEKQCYLEGVNVSQGKRNPDEINNNFETGNVYCNTILSEQKVMLNKIPNKTVPNILKRKVYKESLSQLNEIETNSTSTNIENIENPFTSTIISENSFHENKCSKRRSKHRNLSHKRKQELSSMDACNAFPNYNIHSFIDDEQEMLNRNFFPTVEAPMQQKDLKHCIQKQNERHEMSVIRTEQEKDLPSIFDNVSTDFTSEFHNLSCLQQFESKNLQDSIDFSSNEIFSKFNYEFCDDSSLGNFTDCIMNFDETHNSLSTNYDSDIHKNRCDVNINEVDICERAYWALEKQSLTSPEYWSKNGLHNNKKLNLLSDSCCDYCSEDCVSHWIVNGGSRSNTFLKDKVLTETLNQHTVDTNDNISLNYSNLLNNTSVEVDNKTCLPLIDINNTELTDLINFDDKTDMQQERFKDSVNLEKEKECNAFEDTNHVSFFDTDFNTTSHSSKEHMENEYHIDVLQRKTKYIYDEINRIFQCLLCPLSFSNARTMAMHQAGAHGGMYVILCESCGRLFNRKYHFNRHYIHCGRLKEPFKCDICMKAYRHKSSLIHHLKVTHHIPYAHNRSTTFTCSVCDKKYNKFGAFENHVKRHKDIW